MRTLKLNCQLSLALGLAALATAQSPSDLPIVPEGLNVKLVAKEPLVRNPCAIAFDAQGRLFVGHGPQYRSPKPDTPPDRISILIDTDNDGIADKTSTFAEGFNTIQGLAWRGGDLWVANAPDFTIVRDLDGDDVADEYVKVYTDLGNLEHALHGLNWAPDGKLYFSKGNSTGRNIEGSVAPKPFRELWDVDAPPGSPDFPPPETFTAQTYRKSYHDPSDDWGRQGGILRCGPMGEDLEIVSRGMRNPFSIGYDSGFNWLGTDNDQGSGDRLIMPFFGAHFGWGHKWSADWTGENHLPTVPISGPTFEGSGTGITHYDWPQLPERYRDVWFINDWARHTTFLYRTEWHGPLMQPEGGAWSEFARGGDALFNPVDLQVGPDGALYTTGWGSSYGVVWDEEGNQANEGRLYRIGWDKAPETTWHAPKRKKNIAQWSIAELLEDLDGQLPIWRGNAQIELLQRGDSARQALISEIAKKSATTLRQTWALWTLAQLDPRNANDDALFETLAKTGGFNARIQALRILGHRNREYYPDRALPSIVAECLADSEPRIRFAAAQSILQTLDTSSKDSLIDAAANESDRLVHYTIWQAMRDTIPTKDLKAILADSRGGARRAALLALLDSDSLDPSEVQLLISDKDSETANVAALWIAERSGNPLIVMSPPPGDFTGDEVRVKFVPGIKPATLRHTTDGSEPTKDSERIKWLTANDTTTVKVALFVDDKQVGQTATVTWRKRVPLAIDASAILASPTKPTTTEAVLKQLPAADSTRGQTVFNAAGCYTCHQNNGEGGLYGPNLSNFGDRGNVEKLIRSILYPSEIITEGYVLQSVTTSDGKSYAGVLREETDRILELMQANNQIARIDKTKIETRESLRQSPMPPFEHILRAEDVADLVAWLMSDGTLGSVGGH